MKKIVLWFLAGYALALLVPPQIFTGKLFGKAA